MADSTLSWQSAFWGLVPLALNSMVQPCGNFSDASPKTSFLLRISPVACVFDALVSILYIFEYMFTNLAGIQEASLAWRHIRFADGPDIDEDTTVEMSPFWRCVTSALAIAQGVKLLACTGTLVTQAIAAMFIGSFLVLEFLLRLSTMVNSTTNEGTLTRAVRCANKPATLNCSGLWHSAFSKLQIIMIQLGLGAIGRVYWDVHTLRRDFERDGPFSSPLVGLMSLGMIPLLFVIAYLVTLPFLVACLFAGCLLPFTTKPWLQLEIWYTNWINKVLDISFKMWAQPHILVMFFVGPVLIIRFINMQLGVGRWGCRKLRWIAWLFRFIGIVNYRTLPWVGIGKMSKNRNTNPLWDLYRHAWIPFWSFVTTLLWYSVVYDQSGTYKPKWTDKLG